MKNEGYKPYHTRFAEWLQRETWRINFIKEQNQRKTSRSGLAPMPEPLPYDSPRYGARDFIVDLSRGALRAWGCMGAGVLGLTSCLASAAALAAVALK